jgi:hypothetical protein
MYVISRDKRRYQEDSDEDVHPRAPVRHSTQDIGAANASYSTTESTAGGVAAISASRAGFSAQQFAKQRDEEDVCEEEEEEETAVAPSMSSRKQRASRLPSVHPRAFPSRDARHPGAFAVDGPNADGATRTYLSQDDILSSQQQLVVAAEISPGEDDIEAEISSRLRQQTDAIAAQVRQRIIGDAVQADVMDSTFLRKRYLWITGGVLVVIIGLVVALVIVFVPNDDQTPNPGTVSNPQPSTPPTTELPNRVSALQERLLPIFGDLVSDQSTPQFEALSWLAESDPANLPVESTPLSTLQQRFILATLYFATNGESWTQQYNFLTETDICNWNDETLNGVTCDEVDHISIVLGKYFT